MNRSISKRYRMASRLLGLVAIVLTPMASHSGTSVAGRRFAIKPASSWVLAREAPVPNDSESDKGIVILLSDQQIKVTNTGHEHYVRSVKKVLTNAALEEASQIRIDFEPSYEQLILHYLRLERGGRTINKLIPGEIKLIQQETELDQQLYNGTLTAVAILNDLRPGDTIDYAFTLIGDNPVLGGKFAEAMNMSREWPVKKLTRRLLWPTNRTLNIRALNPAFQPKATPRGSETEYSWELSDVQPTEVEDHTPSWHDSTPDVQLSEFESWDDVVRWNLSLFDARSQLSRPLTNQIDNWRNRYSRNEERFIVALRFVQDEIRYMGIELGPYSHRPNNPSVVFDRRFGDCKDKSLLLCVMLNSLGIEASPALANTEAKNELVKFLPSAYAFDHCIVKATIDGKDYWVDPTISHQGGKLSRLAGVDYGQALVLKEGVTNLEKMIAFNYSEPATVVEEVYSISDYQSPVLFEVTSTYTSADADSLRFSIARKQLSEIAKEYLDYYSDQFPGIEQAALPAITDDRDNNILVVREKYRITGLWREGESSWLRAGAIYGELKKPEVQRRSTPLLIGYPVYTKNVIEIRFPDDHEIRRGEGSIADESSRFEYRYSKKGNTATIEYSYRSTKDNVDPAYVARHLEVVEKMRDAVWYEIKKGDPLAASSEAVAAVIVGGIVVVVLLMLGVFKWGRARFAFARPSGTKPAVRFGLGQGPEMAIDLKDGQEREAYLARVQCTCGASLYKGTQSLVPESLIFDGRRLQVFSLYCPACGRDNSVYFRSPQTDH